MSTNPYSVTYKARVLIDGAEKSIAATLDGKLGHEVNQKIFDSILEKLNAELIEQLEPNNADQR